MEQYTAWMVDLKSSKGYSMADRSGIQSHITAVCGAMTRLFAPSLACAIAFSAGDELQGLFRFAPAAYLCVRLFRMLLWPAQIRAGLGLGAWEIRLPGAGTTAQDGKAYHLARAAITAAEKNDCAALFCSESERDPVINFAIETETVLTRAHTAMQNDLALTAELTYPITVPEAMDLTVLPELAALMEKKTQYGFYSERERRTVRFTHTPQVIAPVNALAADDALRVGGGKTRGVPTAVADSTGIALQSVARTLKTANIYSARNAAIVALRLLRQEEEK